MAGMQRLLFFGIRGDQGASSQRARFGTAVVAGALALLSAACGGGGSSTPSTPVQQNPVPGVSFITPASAPAGSRELTLSVYGSDFVSGCVVQWSGSAKATTYVTGSLVTAVITPADLSTARTVAVTVFNPSPGGGTSNSLSFSVTAVEPLALQTFRLPDAAPGKKYEYSLQASGGIAPYSWSLAGGSLPDGLSLSAEGLISGTPSVGSSETTVSFVAEVSDYAYVPNRLTQPLSILVRASKLGRNDTCDAAVPITSGVLRASISPYADIDVYSFQGEAGASVTAEVYAQRLKIYSGAGTRDIFLDSLLEILDSDCVQLTYHDDIDMGVVQDSRIANYVLPYTGKYYIRVSDLRGDGRPDFIYELHLSGED